MPKSKPKFRVGQVVCGLSTGGKRVYYGRVKGFGYKISPEGNEFYEMNNGGMYLESELRPLTAREIGPRRERKRR